MSRSDLRRDQYNAIQDEQRATSRLLKHWSEDRTSLVWELEVRMEDLGRGTQEMGVLELRGSFEGTLTLAIKE